MSRLSLRAAIWCACCLTLSTLAACAVADINQPSDDATCEGSDCFETEHEADGLSPELDPGTGEPGDRPPSSAGGSADPGAPTGGGGDGGDGGGGGPSESGEPAGPGEPGTPDESDEPGDDAPELPSLPEEDERCDGVDNNCDGAIDEGCKCSEDDAIACGPPTDDGVCEYGVQVCLPGDVFDECRGAIWPSAEICDGLDNDCDGLVDEDFVSLGSACDAATTLCETAVLRCSADGTGLECVVEDSGVEPAEEICDGVDNDCDGLVDEDLVRSCACGSEIVTEAVCVDGEFPGCPDPVTATLDVTVPPLDPDCPFSRGDNLDMIRGAVAARVEQRLALDIPADRYLCSFEIEARSTEFYFDDEVLFGLNDVLLIASRDVLGEFPTIDGLPVYDWPSYRGLDNSSFAGTPSCIEGAIECELPGTQHVGAVALSFDEDANRRLMSLAGEGDGYEFLIVGTGDNDPDIDCHHTGLDLRIHYTYF